MQDKFNALDWISLVLVIIGGLNWGMIGLFGIDVVGSIFGAFSGLTRVIYTLVGLSALYMVATGAKMARHDRYYYGETTGGAGTRAHV